MKKFSNNWFKQKRKVSRIHEHISNQRLDFLHKLSAQIANEYDLVGIETLNMGNMSRSLHLGKSTMDNGFGMFSRFLEYKLKDRGKQLVKVIAWYDICPRRPHTGEHTRRLPAKQVHRSLTSPPSLWPGRELRKYHYPQSLSWPSAGGNPALPASVLSLAFRVMAHLQVRLRFSP